MLTPFKLISCLKGFILEFLQNHLVIVNLSRKQKFKTVSLVILHDINHTAGHINCL